MQKNLNSILIKILNYLVHHKHNFSFHSNNYMNIKNKHLKMLIIVLKEIKILLEKLSENILKARF